MGRKYRPSLEAALVEVDLIVEAIAYLPGPLPFTMDIGRQAIVAEAARRIGKHMRRVPGDVRARNAAMQSFWHFHDSDPDKCTAGSLWWVAVEARDELAREIRDEIARLD